MENPVVIQCIILLIHRAFVLIVCERRSEKRSVKSVGERALFVRNAREAA